VEKGAGLMRGGFVVRRWLLVGGVGGANSGWRRSADWPLLRWFFGGCGGRGAGVWVGGRGCHGVDGVIVPGGLRLGLEGVVGVCGEWRRWGVRGVNGRGLVGWKVGRRWGLSGWGGVAF